MTELVIADVGATLEVYGAMLVIPAGALDNDTTVTATRTEEPIPEGFVGHSKLYRFEPEDTILQVPATLWLDFGSVPARPVVVWSNGEGSFYEGLSSIDEDGKVRASINQLGSGFVAAGGNVGARCEVAGDCLPGLECHGEFFGERDVCTKPCMQDSECSQITANTICVAGIPHYDGGTSESFCLRPCEVAADCNDLGSECDTHQDLAEERYCL